jgi:hypothetical protein
MRQSRRFTGRAGPVRHIAYRIGLAIDAQSPRLARIHSGQGRRRTRGIEFMKHGDYFADRRHLEHAGNQRGRPV